MKGFVILLISAAAFANCKQAGKLAQSNETRVARFRMGVLKVPGNPSTALPLSLEKGEVVTLQKIESFQPAKGAPVEYAKIRIAGGEEGYVIASYLAKGGAVITGEAKLYQRPSITSGLARGSSNIKIGTVVFIENEDYSDGEWIEVAGGSNAAGFFRGWLKGGSAVSKDTETVTAAVRFEQNAEIFKNPKSSTKAKDEAAAALKDLASSAPAPISQLAKDMISEPTAEAPPAEHHDEGIQPLEPAAPATNAN